MKTDRPGTMTTAQDYESLDDQVEIVLEERLDLTPKFVRECLERGAKSKWLSHPVDYHYLAQWFIVHDLFNDACRFGWVLPDGTFYGCDYACHEHVTHLLGREVRSVEEEGWCRVHNESYQSRWRLTPMQRNRLRKMNIEIDNTDERLKEPIPHD